MKNILVPSDDYIRSTFPSGECYIKLKELYYTNVRLIFTYQGDASFMELLMITNALKIRGVTDIQLRCKYFPGCRSDRVGDKNEGEALSVKVYADLINAQGYSNVEITDPHSNVTPALINNVHVISNTYHVADLLKSFNNEQLVIVAPDAGATKKINDIVDLCNTRHKLFLHSIQAFKQRDMATGKLVPGSCRLSDQNIVRGRTCVIVDDICSKGGTFIALGKCLRDMGATEILLVVSHLEGHDIEDKLRNEGFIDQVYYINTLKNNNLNENYFKRI
jgi:ribose-phosphate pyrophosphokinase